MQHSNYRTTLKHYIDRQEVAKQMVRNGFRVFPEQKTKKAFQQGTPVIWIGLKFIVSRLSIHDLLVLLAAGYSASEYELFKYS